MNVNLNQGGIHPTNFNPQDKGDLKELKQDLTDVKDGKMDANELLAKYVNNPIESPKPGSGAAPETKAGGAEGSEGSKDGNIIELLMKLLEMIMGKDKAPEGEGAGDAAGGSEKPGGSERSAGSEKPGGAEESKDGIKEAIMQILMMLISGKGGIGGGA